MQATRQMLAHAHSARDRSALLLAERMAPPVGSSRPGGAGSSPATTSIWKRSVMPSARWRGPSGIPAPFAHRVITGSGTRHHSHLTLCPRAGCPAVHGVRTFAVGNN